jgi:cytochrome P450
LSGKGKFSSLCLAIVIDVQAQLREEIDTAVAELQHSGDTIRFADAQKMSYLQACIKEGLRIHPVTGLPLARVVPKEGAMISGRYFPAGAVVGVSAWIANSNVEVFGADADVFRPERWLGDAEAVAAMDRNLLSVSAP